MGFKADGQGHDGATTPSQALDLDAPEIGASIRRDPWGMAWRWGVWLAIAAPLMVVHYVTPVRPELAALHDIHQYLLFIPVILAAFWHGLRGGLAVAAAIFVLYVAHFHAGASQAASQAAAGAAQAMAGHAGHHMGAGPAYRLPSLFTGRFPASQLLEGATYLLVGGVTGYLADRLRVEQGRLRVALAHLRRSARNLFESEERLRQADRLTALGRLSAGLAHEIRNPLGSIRGAAEILNDPETPAAQREEFGRVLIAETERLDGVLSNFLDYARAQRAGADGGPCDLAETIERLRTLTDKKLKASGVAVTTRLAPDLPRLAIGQGLLQQALLNVVLNAAAAMPEGGALTIEAGVPIRLDPDASPRMVTIAVSDVGPGIPPELRARVFDPFYTTRTAGSGLGLAIVHKIVTGVGGTVAIEDAPGGGARVVLALPEA
jgi:signal transduction histidine kinase